MFAGGHPHAFPVFTPIGVPQNANGILRLEHCLHFRVLPRSSKIACGRELYRRNQALAGEHLVD